MKTEVEIEAMRRRAYRDQFRAKDQGDAEGLAYAEGVEAALLWALGNIKESDLTGRMDEVAAQMERERRRAEAKALRERAAQLLADAEALEV